MAITINDNTINMAQYKGEIKRCPFCTPKRTGNKELDERNLLEALSSTTACKWCMSQRFISICTNCKGSGKFDGRTIWDGGAHPHTTTCNPCNGSGMYPARKPANWVETDEQLTSAVADIPKVIEPITTNM